MASRASEWVTTQEPDAAFDRLFQAEYRTVVGVAYRVLGDSAEAEDIAQEVFCQFYRRYSADVSWAAPWLYRAAAHAALNHIRGTKRRMRRESRDAREGERFGGIAGAALDPQIALEEAERRRDVRRALSRIPKKSATALVLRYSGLSYAEVAAALDIGVNGVGTVLRRAEAALRKEMNNETFE